MTDGGGGDLDRKPLLEANLANEVATTVLDLVELFIQHFKVSVKKYFFFNIRVKLFSQVYRLLAPLPDSNPCRGCSSASISLSEG